MVSISSNKDGPTDSSGKVSREWGKIIRTLLLGSICAGLILNGTMRGGNIKIINTTPHQKSQQHPQQDNQQENTTKPFFHFDQPDPLKASSFTNQYCDFNGTTWYPSETDSWQMRAPYFMLLGAKKAGSTSLSAYLRYHPLVIDARAKELYFFTHVGTKFHEKFINSQQKVMVKEARQQMLGIDYNTSALQSDPSLISMDATPDHIFFRNMTNRILCVAPWIKLLAILRDPVDRAYSNYEYNFRILAKRDPRIEKPSFEQWISPDLADLRQSGFLNATNEQDELKAWDTYLTRRRTEGPIARSLYQFQLHQWFTALRQIGRSPKESIYIVRTEDMKRDVQSTMDGIYKFLGLPPSQVLRKVNSMKSDYERPMDNATKSRLEDFFRPYNKRLYEFLVSEGFGEDWKGFWAREKERIQHETSPIKQHGTEQREHTTG